MGDQSLREALKKREPFAAADVEALLSIWRTSDVLDIEFARLLRGYGLTPAQYNVMRILRGEGAALPCLEIASRLVAQVPGITGLIDRLEALGHVGRERSTEDRRVVRVGLTAKGAKLIGELDGPVAEFHERVLGHLTPRELASLNRLLEKARSRC